MYRLLLTLSAICAVAPATADVFARQDPEGVIHYTNVAGQEGYARIIEVLIQENKPNRAGAKQVPAGVAEYAAAIESAASEFNVDKALVHAVITAESGYNASAVSRAGAQGLMQLMPMTARRYEVADAFDPEENIRGGTRYLSDLLALFDGNLTLAVAAYNAGENAVIRHRRTVPPFRETQAYVPKVLGLYEKYRRIL